ncbi:MAG: hypothetical protein ACRDGR_00555 [bacterium]
MQSGFARVALSTVVWLVLAAPGLALEKRAARLTDDDQWRSAGTSTSCLVDYFDVCTGWVWVWSGWRPEERIGVCFSSCCPAPLSAAGDTSYVYFYSGAPAGYGFTGTVDVFAVDADCCPVGVPLSTQPLLPTSGWNSVVLGHVSVPPEFAVTFTFGSAANLPIAVVTDHPAQGPTGPPACGTCYPPTRPTRSFWWGTATSPFCPGSVLNDGFCNAEFLWEVGLHCEAPVALESKTWGGIKGLYR